MDLSMVEEAGGGADQQYRVLSLGRALDLLEIVARKGKEGGRLTDLSHDLGLSKASTFAILQTLLSRGYVADIGKGSTRRYRLGMALARLGDLAISNVSLADVALPVLRDLTDELGLTSRLAILDDGYAVVVGRIDAPGAIKFDAALGRRELPHCSAVGKALLAALPKAEATAILRRLELSRRTPHTIVARGELLKELSRSAERGYAVDNEEDHEGVACVGACVFDRSGHAAGAISVTGLKSRDWEARQKTLAAGVMRAAARISQQLGAVSRPHYPEGTTEA
jgi:IclR family transcriptional regulator, acetate operon repressor